MVANVSISVELSHVECYVCKKTPTVLFQLDGGDYEDYIGRFLCKKHLNQLRREFSKESAWPAPKQNGRA